MRFLVVSLSKHPAPPEMTLGLMKAVEPWKKQFADKFEQMWWFAGTQGGGGILNVKSLEELDTVMGAFPFLPLSDIQIFPLTDLDASLQRGIQALETSLKATT